MKENCFIVMSISEQTFGEIKRTSNDLRSDYDNVIKVALLNARPHLNIVRSDDCAVPGTITEDILKHLMYDDFVIVDITYPNPNVFYELGIRHCCKPGTILIRNSTVKINTPFDLSHQRHVEYECTPKGIQKLTDDLKGYFKWFDENLNKPDNQVLQLSQHIKFNFPQYSNDKDKSHLDAQKKLISLFITNPKLMNVATSKTISEEDRKLALIQKFGQNPEALNVFLNAALKGGTK